MGQAFEYKYRPGAIHKVSAEVAGPICQRLHDSNQLTPHNLVEAARPVDSPMHDEFIWDDSVAAEKYREEQARMVIKSIVLVESNSQAERSVKLEKADTEKAFEYDFPKQTEDSVPADRAFVSTGERNHRYVPLLSALTNETWKENLLRSAKKDMESFVSKYHRLDVLSGIIEDMNDFLSA